MKKTISRGILILVILVSIFGCKKIYATESSFEVKSTEGELGEQVTIQVQCNVESPVVAARLEILYDENQLEYVNGQTGEAVSSGMNIIKNIEDQSLVRLVYVSQEQDANLKQGNILELTFRIKESADKTIPITLEIKELVDKDQKEIPYTILNGAIVTKEKENFIIKYLKTIPIETKITYAMIVLVIIILIATIILVKRRKDASKKI